jgi:hypothetical protein
MFETSYARDFKGLARAVDRTPVNDEDAFRPLRNADEVLHTPGNARQAGHLTYALAGKTARNTVVSSPASEQPEQA